LTTLARKIFLLMSLAYVALLALVGNVSGMLVPSALVVALLGLIGLRLRGVEKSQEPELREGPTTAAPRPSGAPTPTRWAFKTDAGFDNEAPLSRATGLALVAILLLAAGLRLHRLSEVPAGFFCDEASIGYNAYSILETGRDEHGVALPLYFRAFGEYKNPVYIYTTAASIALFGLNEFGTRFPAAFYGVLTVLLAFLVGRQLYGHRTGLLAAGLLAISPWHLHFSRIAFELITLPFFFCLGLWLLLSGIAHDSRRRLAASGIAFGLSLYTYAIARLFVPLFLLGFAVLYFRSFRRVKYALALGVALFLVVATPQIVYAVRNPENVSARWASIGALREDATLSAGVNSFADKYLSHLTSDFLFEHGDPLKRHSVRGAGELYRATQPWLLLGVALLAVARQRQGLLLLFWLALFPVAASLTRETPSATRSIDAIPVFELVVAYAFHSVVTTLRRQVPGRPGQALVWVAVLAFVLPLGIGFRRYLSAYFVDYPLYSAGGVDGFQHGYRETIQYMEAHRREYDLLMLTATDVNQPEMLALFFSQRDPALYLRTHETGYRVSVPEEYGRYPSEARILYALRPQDLRYFLDYETRLRVIAPDGGVSFIVAEVGTRRPMILDWQLLGLLPRSPDQTLPEPLDPLALDARQTLAGRKGPISWQPFNSQFANLDLNRRFSDQAAETGGNPEQACAYLWTEVLAPRSVAGVLEVFGSPDAATLWWNGARLAHFEPMQDRADPVPVEIVAGSNQLLIRTCESDGDWNLQVSLVGEDHRAIPGLRFETPPPHAPGPGRRAGASTR
jgi:4-amino-4-deoxy-L-arabinose transferase-like glycosyltransferase